MTYSCDICGRACSRTHELQAYGLDTIACDDCADYEWEAYDEPADPLLYPDLCQLAKAGATSGCCRLGQRPRAGVIMRPQMEMGISIWMSE